MKLLFVVISFKDKNVVSGEESGKEHYQETGQKERLGPQSHRGQQ